MRFAVYAVVLLLWVTAIFEIFGGTFVWRAPLIVPGHENGTAEYRLSLYHVQPPPKGPPQCDFVTVGHLSAALPCDLRPPFVDMVKRYF